MKNRDVNSNKFEARCQNNNQSMMYNQMSKTKRKFKVQNEKSRCEYKFEARCQNLNNNQLKRFFR